MKIREYFIRRILFNWFKKKVIDILVYLNGITKIYLNSFTSKQTFEKLKICFLIIFFCTYLFLLVFPSVIIMTTY